MDPKISELLVGGDTKLESPTSNRAVETVPVSSQPLALEPDLSLLSRMVPTAPLVLQEVGSERDSATGTPLASVLEM